MRVIAFPLDVDNSEGYLLNEAKLWAEGTSPYRDFHKPPYLVANYTPLYSLILAVPARLGSLSFAWGRALSTLAVIEICGVIYLILWGRTKNHYWSAVGAFLFPSFYHVYSWGPLHRVDLLALLFAALGLLAIERKCRVAWPVILFLLAFFTRQTFVAPVLVGAWFLGKEKGKRDAWWLLGGFAGGVALIGGFLTLLTGGEFFRHTVLYNVNAFRWENAWVYQLHLWRYTAVFVALGLGYMLLRDAERPNDWLRPYLLLAWLVSITAGKEGSAENYLLEFVFAVCVAVPLVTVRLRAALAERRELVFLVPLLLLFGCLQNFHVPRSEGLPGQVAFFGSRYDYAYTPAGNDSTSATALIDEGKLLREPVLSQYPGWALLSGHEVLFHTFLVRQLSEEGNFDEEILLRKVRGKAFSGILIGDDLGESPDPARFVRGSDRFSGEFYAAMIETGYKRRAGVLGRYYLYQPMEGL
jgi:hypothetical protein